MSRTGCTNFIMALSEASPTKKTLKTLDAMNAQLAIDISERSQTHGTARNATLSSLTQGQGVIKKSKTKVPLVSRLRTSSAIGFSLVPGIKMASVFRVATRCRACRGHGVKKILSGLNYQTERRDIEKERKRERKREREREIERKRKRERESVREKERERGRGRDREKERKKE
jgi:hypothetical protein